MLQSLHIENVAVIEKADIVFSNGLTVLTGETGAGKSIVIDAINAVLGERITRDVVRNGTDRAYISAVFGDVSASVVAVLEEQGFSLEEDGTLLIQRSVSADGKGNCRINGRPATVSVLRQIGRMLVNMHGQHENQVLLDPESHVEYLDRLDGLQDIRNAYENEYHGYCRIQRRIKAATMDEEEKARREEQLRRQIEEIDAAGLQIGEEEQLLSRREMAKHAEKLMQALQTVRALLEGGEDGEHTGALTQIMEAESALRPVSGVSKNLEELAARLQSALYDIQACAEETRDAEKTLCFDEQDLERLEDRLALIRHVVRKYGVDEADVLQKREEMQLSLDTIEQNEEHLAQLQEQSSVARQATIAAAERLTQARRKAAAKFEKTVCEQLAFLDMPHVRLEVSMQPTALTSTGGENVEFLIASNPGEPAKSIAKTASGGELSRVMLAMKSVLAKVDDIDTLVFDEVDSGISGHAATKVGTLLRQIAGCRQVLCVTHLAQVAANGHDHLLVSKQVENGRTYTDVSSLDESRRLQELARIIGGEVTETAVQAAREMRQRAVTSA